MKVEVKLFAGFRSYMPKSLHSSYMDVPDGSTVGDIILNLGIPKEVKKIIFVNGVHGTNGTVLREKDRLAIFPPVAGG
jgi:molybdopterin converting factor small subunit